MEYYLVNRKRKYERNPKQASGNSIIYIRIGLFGLIMKNIRRKLKMRLEKTKISGWQ
jgi:hypothetical protein